MVRNKSDFNLPIKKDRDGNYKLPIGSFVRVCMASDFFLEEADAWRMEAWDMIRRRPDVTFSLLTKRLEQRIPYLLDLPAKHRWVISLSRTERNIKSETVPNRWFRHYEVA